MDATSKFWGLGPGTNPLCTCYAHASKKGVAAGFSSVMTSKIVIFSAGSYMSAHNGIQLPFGECLHITIPFLNKDGPHC